MRQSFTLAPEKSPQTNYQIKECFFSPADPYAVAEGAGAAGGGGGGVGPGGCSGKGKHWCALWRPRAENRQAAFRK